MEEEEEDSAVVVDPKVVGAVFSMVVEVAVVVVEGEMEDLWHNQFFREESFPWFWSWFIKQSDSDVCATT